MNSYELEREEDLIELLNLRSEMFERERVLRKVDNMLVWISNKENTDPMVKDRVRVAHDEILKVLA